MRRTNPAPHTSNGERATSDETLCAPSVPLAANPEEQVIRRFRTQKTAALLALIALGYVRVTSNQIGDIRPLHRETIALAQALDNRHGLVGAYVSAAGSAYYQGRYEEASTSLDKCLPLCRGLNSPGDTLAFAWMPALVAREQGQLEVAYAAVIECLDIGRANSAIRWEVANMLLSAGYLLLRCGDANSVVILMGASHGCAKPSTIIWLPLSNWSANALKRQPAPMWGSSDSRRHGSVVS